MIIMFGFGGIQSALLAALVEREGVNPADIRVISKDTPYMDLVKKYQVPYTQISLTPDNLQEVVSKYVNEGDLISNLTCDVDSLELQLACLARGAAGFDTSCERWKNEIADPTKGLLERSGAIENMRWVAARDKLGRNTSTWVKCMGMNPGIVSLLAQEALERVAKSFGEKNPELLDKLAAASSCGEKAKLLGLRTIQISEHDTQISNFAKPRDVFANTWSEDGFFSEGIQGAAMALGTHETGGLFEKIPNTRWGVLDQAGLRTKWVGWTPLIDFPEISGIFEGFLIDHDESVSIARHFAQYDKKTGELEYMPSVGYCYKPCALAELSVIELLDTQKYQIPPKKLLLRDEIVEGRDELGVHLLGVFEGRPWSYWLGSILSIEEARKIAPHNNATSLQVVGGCVAALKFCIENPKLGMLEADELPKNKVLDWATPYLGGVVGMFTDFNPYNLEDPYFSETHEGKNFFSFEDLRKK